MTIFYGKVKECPGPVPETLHFKSEKRFVFKLQKDVEQQGWLSSL